MPAAAAAAAAVPEQVVSAETQAQQVRPQQQQQHPAAVATTNATTATAVNMYGCKCRRTACLKKYCECFQNATYCGVNCQCVSCQNTSHAGVVVHQQHVVGDAAAATATVASSSSSSPPSSWARTVLPRAILGQHLKKAPTTPMAGAAATGTATTASPRSKLPPPPPTDHLTMMAALAMTELFGGKGGVAHKDKRNDNDTLIAASKREKPVSATPVVVVKNNHSEKSTSKASTREGATKPILPKHHRKRKIVPQQQQRDHAEMGTSEPDSKKAKASHTKMLAADDEEVVRAVSSLESVASAESRNPSPTSITAAQPHMLPPSVPHYSVRHGHSPLQHQQQQQQQHLTTYQSHHHGGIYARGPASPPCTMSSYRPAMASTPQHRYHHHHRSQQQYHARASPPTPHLRFQAYTPSSMYNPFNAPPLPTPYEDFVRTSGLPKSLSFRKICSKCGKTRGEHGELGFGNKCVYQECGKCGAGIQTHLSAHQPMGILCKLTVQQGAVPGAAATYERKIRELAVRADLQKELQRRKQQQQQETPDRVVSMSA